MTAYNRHLLAEGAYRVNREAAAREERDAVVAFLRRQAADWDGMAVHRKVRAAKYSEQGDHRGAEAERADAERDRDTAAVLRKIAVCVEAGDHLR